MQTDNPPDGELRFIPVREGRYRLIVMDRHKQIHEEAAGSLRDLAIWLEEQDGEIGFPINLDDREHVQDLLDVHGAVHVRTPLDVDLVFVKGGAPRG
jgi:hypothetical protein